MLTDIERLLPVFVADLHRTRRKFIRSKSFVQLKTFCADEITVDGCSMDRAYEARMQWGHNGCIAFSNGWQDLFTFYILFASVSAVGPGLYCVRVRIPYSAFYLRFPNDCNIQSSFQRRLTDSVSDFQWCFNES